MTASQFLKQDKNKEYAASVKNTVTNFVAGRVHNVGHNVISKYVNWFIKELIQQNINKGVVSAVLDNWWDNVGDWIVANVNNNQANSKFNLVDFTYADAVEESEEWHAAMRANTKSPGREGRTVVDLAGVPGFAGWKWVALDRVSCSKEAEAMGHCGNTGGKTGDNILSLRDPENVVHLTFINNQGVLGEMKGRGNSKPSKKYHPAIMQLLLSNEIASIEGGGYAPKNNFSLDDLTPEQKALIRGKKPYIDQPDKFKKKREFLIRGLEKKAKREALSKSTTDDVGKVIGDILDRLIDREAVWDEKPDSREIPHVVYEKTVWKFYQELLDETYKRGKNQHPQELFAWMDRAIEGFISKVVEYDKKIYENIPNKDYSGFYEHLSNIVKLDELVYNLNKMQPRVLLHAPKRYNYSSYKEYIEDLKDYLDGEGYDLPSYRPDNNMISYEFNAKAASEIARQGREIAELVRKSRENQDPRITRINDMGRYRRAAGQFDDSPAPKNPKTPDFIHRDDLDNI